jgi:hypothetical protein
MTKTAKLFSEKKRTHEVTAQRIWSYMVGYLAFRQDGYGLGEGIITYGNLAVKVGYDTTKSGLAIVEPVKLVSRFCSDNDLPYLTSMIVREDTKHPGWDDMFPSEKKYLKAQNKVLKYGDKWLDIVPPSGNVFKKYK